MHTAPSARRPRLTPAAARRAVRVAMEATDDLATLQYRRGGTTVEFRFTRRTRGAQRPTGTVSPSLANDLMLGLELGRKTH